MTIRVQDGGSFRFRHTDESRGFDDNAWTEGRIPFDWYRAYRKPIVILKNGISESSVREIFEEENAPRMGEWLAEKIGESIESHYGMKLSLPPVTFVVARGGIASWRRSKGHFIACRCNGCGDVHPSYWIETDEDVVRAQRMERRHPAVPFIHDRAIVTFRSGEFVGCFCGVENWETHDPNEAIELESICREAPEGGKGRNNAQRESA